MTHNEMKKLFEVTASDLNNAKLFLAYYQDLGELLREKFSDVAGYCWTFWSNTIRAYHESMAKYLMRAYEQRISDCIGLPYLLNCIKNNIALFPEEKRDETLRQCKKDEKFVKSGSNEKIKILVFIRHKNGAHRDANLALGKATHVDLEKMKLEMSDIQDLIDTGINILNYYSQLFNKNIFSSYMVGYGDHEVLFQIMQKHHQAILLEQENFLKQHNLELQVSQ